MNSLRKFVLLIFCAFVFTVTNAQQFACEHIKTIYKNLPRAHNGLVADSIWGFPIYIAHDNNTVYDIGVSMPHLAIDDATIKAFVERKMLELMLATNRHDIGNVLDRSKCKLLYNGDDYQRGTLWEIPQGIEVLRTCNKVSYQRKDTHFYLVAENEQNQLGITFPVNIQIITDKDKKELEDEFEVILRNNQSYDIYADTLIKDNFKQEGNMFINNTEHLYIEAMNNATYYTYDNNGKFYPIYSPDYIVESFTNMFHHTNENTQNVELHISQSLYGKQTKEYTLTLDKLFAYCKTNKLKVFVGIENEDENNIESTVILQNDKLNFVHLLHVKSNVPTLFNATGGKMAVRLYTYIPTDNVKNLFNTEFRKRETKTEI